MAKEKGERHYLKIDSGIKMGMVEPMMLLIN
jgi:hypothetical protein